MAATIKQKIPTYTMKLRLYPSPSQKNTMEQIFRALHIAYNITFHQVFLLNPAVCTAPNKNGAVWPSYKNMAQKEWREFLIKENPAVEAAPAASLMNQNGLFHLDGKRAWQTGMHNIPVNPESRRDFRFYSAAKPRRSFFVQVEPQRVLLSDSNEKVVWITVPKVGKIKARGFNTKLRFGAEGQHTYAEALQAGELPKQLSVRISKDTCGDYFASITFSEGKKKDRELYLQTPAPEHKEPLGVDVGIKDVAILSNGQKVENRNFKREKKSTLSRLNRQLSRQWGPANMAFRDYNCSLRQQNLNLPEELKKPLAKPSRGYLKSQKQKAKVERSIARRRDTYYHQQTAMIVRQSQLIALETLHVSNMLRNHKLAYALADAAMSDFLGKLKYKAERHGVPVLCIGTFVPTSQLCSVCGAQYPGTKDLSVRTWRCPHCAAVHDRDINAARNILKTALSGGGITDQPIPGRSPEKPVTAGRIRRRGLMVDPEEPDIVVAFSRELTRNNDPRYIIQNSKTKETIDDAQGAGYRSASNARNCYRAKRKWAGRNPSPQQ